MQQREERREGEKRGKELRVIEQVCTCATKRLKMKYGIRGGGDERRGGGEEEGRKEVEMGIEGPLVSPPLLFLSFASPPPGRRRRQPVSERGEREGAGEKCATQ
eukprot:768739-Hanusia_phi.AAC.3